MTGVGVFSEENRSLVVSEYKGLVNTTSDNYVKSIYELLFRHFSVFGTIQDIVILQYKGSAIISYIHRCMAELAKEALMLRGLDDNEILTIRWATEEQLLDADKDHNTKLQLDQEEEIVDKVNKKMKRERGELKDRFSYQKSILNDYHADKKKEQKIREDKIRGDCQKMNNILNQIDNDNDNDNDGGSGGGEDEQDQPLTFNH